MRRDIAATSTTNIWHLTDTAPDLEIYADVDFDTSSGQTWLPGDPTLGTLCRRVALSVVGNELLFPVIENMDSTEDSPNNQQATFSAYIRASNTELIPWLLQFKIPPSVTIPAASISWTHLRILKNGIIARNVNETMTRQQIIDALELMIQEIAEASHEETPAGLVNGVNTTFVWSHTPTPGSLKFFWNKQLQQEGVDYTLNGAVMTTAVAPFDGDWLYGTYLTATPLIVGASVPSEIIDGSNTVLTFGTIADRRLFRRSGTTIIGSTGLEEVFDSADYGSLNAAVTAIGATPGTLLITTANFPGGNSCTVPSTLKIDFGSVGSLLLTTGQTATIVSDAGQWPVRKLFFNALAGQGAISLEGNNLLTSVHAEWWGATGNAKQVGNATISIGTAVVNSTTAGFVPGDVGKVCAFLGAGPASAGLTSTIISYQSATQVTMADNASTGVGGMGQVFTWGTDNAAAFAAAYAAAPTYGCVLWIPSTNQGFMISSFPTITKPVSIIGGLGGTNSEVVLAKGPKLVWVGGAAPMITIQNVEGGAFENMALDCSDKATKGLLLDYIHGWSFRKVFVYRAATVAVHLGSSGADGSYDNKFHDCQFQSSNAQGGGLLLSTIGAGTAGAYLNNFYSLWIAWSGAANTRGIQILSGDNNTFYSPFVTPIIPGDLTAYAYQIGDYTGSSFSAYDNYMFHPQLVQGTLVGSSVIGNLNPGAFYGLNMGNTNEGVTYFPGSPAIGTLTVTAEGLNSGNIGWQTISPLRIGPTLRFQATGTTPPGTTLGGFTADGVLNVLTGASAPGSILFGLTAVSTVFELKTGTSAAGQKGGRFRRGDNLIDAPVMCSQIIPTNHLVYSAGETTPSAADTNWITFSNGGATTVTNFLTPETNHILYILFTNGNTTIENNANIKLAGGANFVGTADDVLQLVWMGTAWREVSRSVN